MKGAIKHLFAIGEGVLVQWQVHDSEENLYCRIAISDGIYFVN